MSGTDKLPSRNQPQATRDFRVKVRGYPAIEVVAVSAGAARYATFRKARDAGIYRCFRLFMRDTRVCRPELAEVRP